MAFGIVHHFPGGTREQYEASIGRVHPADGSLPPGQLFHFAGATDDGWIVVAVHDSRESWERFRDETLMPGIKELGDRGFGRPPEEMTIEVHNLQQASKAPAA
jgi:hypothetical protein